MLYAQIILPFASIFGHLAGLLFGLVLMTRFWNNYLMPRDGKQEFLCILILVLLSNTEKIRQIEGISWLSCIIRLRSYSLNKDRDLRHASADLPLWCTDCCGRNRSTARTQGSDYITVSTAEVDNTMHSV